MSSLKRPRENPIRYDDLGNKYPKDYDDPIPFKKLSNLVIPVSDSTPINYTESSGINSYTSQPRPYVSQMVPYVPLQPRPYVSQMAMRVYQFQRAYPMAPQAPLPSSRRLLYPITFVPQQFKDEPIRSTKTHSEITVFGRKLYDKLD